MIPANAVNNVELWRPVPNWRGLYELSDRGRVRSVARTITDARGVSRRVPGRVLRLCVPASATGGTAPRCTLSAPGRRQTYYPRAATGAARIDKKGNR